MEFNKNQHYQNSGFVQYLNKKLDYTNELKNLTNLYKDKLNKLEVLLLNNVPVSEVQKQVQSLTSNVLTDVNNLTYEINSLTKELNTLNDLTTSLSTQLANINKLTYTSTTTTTTTKITVDFNLQKMQTAASFNN